MSMMMLDNCATAARPGRAEEDGERDEEAV